ncbi:MAG: hypothetical protein ACRDRH_14505 [Pseudonocardia sp.]
MHARGRPTKFHNAACRKRAYRAQLASQHAHVLDALTAVEAAVAELRRAMHTESNPPESASRQLMLAATEVARRLTPEPSYHSGSTSQDKPPVQPEQRAAASDATSPVYC